MLMEADRATVSRPDRRARRPWKLSWVRSPWCWGLIAYLVLALIVASYARALMNPGRASVSVRTVEWVREHGGGPLVDAAENVWYIHRAPPTTAPYPSRVPLGAGAAPATGGVSEVPAALPAIGSRPAAGEGRWLPVPVDKGPVMFETFLRPDPAHPGVTAGVARFDQHLVSAELIAGTKEPTHDTGPLVGQVPPGQLDNLVATFNSGFKMRDAQGGYYARDRVARPLREGAASLVIDRAGRISVDMWGRDNHLGSDIAAVRQNLSLIVDNKAPVPGLGDNAGGRWGSTRNQMQYTWRSALGVDAAGNLYYVAGDQLTLMTLARALADTGAVRGMELDMHPAMVHLFSYRHSTGAASLTPSPLLTEMRGPADRYLSPDRRDFIMLTLHPGH